MPIRIYTVGHSNSTPGDFIDLLHRYGIKALVDVRSAPHSRYVPHFNREALPELMQDAGIDYHYAGEYLGGRPKDHTCYKLGKVPTGKVNYLKLVDYPVLATRPWFQRGIERLLQIAEKHTTTLMCSEEDPHHCHRFHLITPVLEASGIEVVHLRHKDEVQEVDPEDPQQLSLF